MQIFSYSKKALAKVTLRKHLFDDSLSTILLEILAVLTLFILSSLLVGNMTGNEVGKMALAKQYVVSDWIEKDWYLNQTQTYQMLFQALFGRLIIVWGFLATSLVGRLMYYCLVATGMVLISHQIQLSKPLLLIAIALFLRRQSTIAGESMIGSLEPKGFAYGLILLAFWLALRESYLWMAVMLGLATSFHVLVGGYATLTLFGWIVWQIWQGKIKIFSFQHIAIAFLLYLAASIFALVPILENLAIPIATNVSPTSSHIASYIYVFLRNPHHLNPFAWKTRGWIWVSLYLFMLGFAFIIIQWRCYLNSSQSLSKQHVARVRLFEFTTISLIPFILGLAIAPFDKNGNFLQYYPFRLGDVLLPLNACLLFSCVVEQIFTTRKAKKVLLLACVLLLTGIYSIKAVKFAHKIVTLRYFPNEVQGVNRDKRKLYDWIKSNTVKEAIIISSPTQLVEFTCFSERATIVKFKHVPSNKAAILSWYSRLNDLKLDPSTWKNKVLEVSKNLNTAYKSNDDGYSHLTTTQAKALMLKYQAEYFLTTRQHSLDLPIAYHNQEYILYQNQDK